MESRSRVQGRVARWAARVALVAAVAGAAVGCDKGGQKPSPEAAEVLAPVPAPAGLIADVFMPHPNATWVRLRDMLGGPVKMMPASYPMLVVTMLGLPPSVVEEIDADVPTLGAATSDGKEEMPVLGIHIKNGPKLLNLLTAGPEARFVAKADAPSRVTLLEPREGQTSLTASLGITGNYLLLGYAPDGLLKLGPYVARTLPTKAAPKEDLSVVASHDALAGPLRTRLSIWWGETRRSLEKADKEQRALHGGSAPSFGDPMAALQKADATFQGLFTVMADLSEGRMTLVLDDAGAHLRASLTPQAADGVAGREFASMVTGPAAPLLDLPSGCSAALLMRDSPEARERSAQDQGEAIEKLFAGKLSDGDKKRLRDVLASWSKGRGDWMVVGGKIAQEQRSVFARSSIADADTLDKGIRTTFDLLKVPALAEPLGHWLGALDISTPAALEGPRGAWVRVERTPPAVQPPDGKAPPEDKGKAGDKKAGDKKAGEKKTDEKKTDEKKASDKGKGKGKETKTDREVFELAWSLDKETATYVGSRNVKEALREYGEPGPLGSLRAEADIKAMVEALGDEASFALLMLPMRLVGGMLPKAPVSRPPAAPLLIAFGKDKLGGWFRVDASPAALREVAKVRPLN